jgi:hypothetical protein
VVQEAVLVEMLRAVKVVVLVHQAKGITVVLA